MKPLSDLLKFVYLNSLPASLFDDEIPLSICKKLFKKYVKTIEIENHSYCNRTCSFCTNSFVDRRSGNILFDSSLFHRLLDDLQSIGYSNILTWSRYHEPLAHSSIYDSLTLARTKLPDAYLRVNTNADFLSSQVLQTLSSIAINELKVSLYPDSKDHLTSLLSFLQYRTQYPIIPAPKHSPFSLILNHPSIFIPIFVPIFDLPKLSNRAGSIGSSNYHRDSICTSPLKHVCFDFNGLSPICCQTRSDLNTDAIVKSRFTTTPLSVFETYRALAPLRKSLLTKSSLVSPCLSCNANLSSPWIRRLT